VSRSDDETPSIAHPNGRERARRDEKGRELGAIRWVINASEAFALISKVMRSFMSHGSVIAGLLIC